MQATGGNLSVKVGNNTSHSTADEHTISATELRLTGKSKITLSVGDSTITLTPALIEIKGPLVKINC